ncbi:hypothetical protein ABXV19_08710 [Pseudomonas alkylphenolica]|uniref:hypothetical protein n=1 Tax=Pseudomonas alkylphenolica TaxID=237609 RepID=UPI00339256C2
MSHRRTYLAAFVLVVSDSHAYEQELAVNNLAHDFAQCAAYYTLGSKGAEKRDPDLAVKMDQAASFALEMSTGLTSKKVAAARYNMSLKSMMEDMDDSFNNFSIVINEYADQCKEIMDDPKTRLQYWLDKKD